MATFANFRVNWSRPVTERFSFSTQIFTSGSGREVREARRMAPRWEITFTAIIDRDMHRRLVALMTGYREDEIIFPVPTVHCRTTGESGYTNEFFRLVEAERPDWIRVDEFVMIENRFYKVTRVTPTGFDGERIDGDPGDKVFPGGEDRTQNTPTGTKITYATRGRLASQIEVDFQTSRTGEAEIVLQPSPKSWVPYDPDEHQLGEFGGLGLFDFRVNWRDAVNTRYDQQREDYVAETGPAAYYWRSVPTVRYWTTPHTAKNHAEARRMISFFVDQRGRAKTFFYPAVASELQINDRIDKNESEVALIGNDLAVALEYNLSPQFILIETRSGKRFFRQLAGVYQVGDNTRVQLVAPIPERVDSRDVLNVRALYQSRFADDILEVEWVTDTVAQIEMKVRSIDYVEGPVALLMSENDLGLITESEVGTAHITTEEGGGYGY